ncbi:MAG: branched-chain amino acid ABC transporter permease [Chloroflexi bacterium]|nr:branched-chain amino acid ABC transporter permease [Chloroflexota bacterium]
MSELLQYMITGLMIGGLYALVAVPIVLVFKATEVVSIAHGAVLAFGALFFWFFFVALGLPVWLAILLMLAGAGLLGLIIERFTLRPLIGQPLFSAFFMTVAIYMILDGIFALILKGGAVAWPAFLPTGHVYPAGVRISLSLLTTFGISLLLFGILMVFFRYTRMGLAMRATAEDHQLSQSVGISVQSIFLLVWIISAMVAAVAGIATGNVMGVSYYLPFFIMLKGLVAALFGGLDSIPGALVGGLTLGVFESVAAGYLDPLVGGSIREVAAFVFLLFILIGRPSGVFGLARIERV